MGDVKALLERHAAFWNHDGSGEPLVRVDDRRERAKELAVDLLGASHCIEQGASSREVAGDAGAVVPGARHGWLEPEFGVGRGSRINLGHGDAQMCSDEFDRRAW